MGLKETTVGKWWLKKRARNINQPPLERVHNYWEKINEPTPEVVFGIRLSNRIASKIYGFSSSKYKDELKLPFTNTSSDDFQFWVDDLAEAEVEKEFEIAWKNGLNYGYVTEAQRLHLPPSGKADTIFYIDPFDGSRVKENGTITMVGVPGNIENPKFSDIQFAITNPINDQNNFLLYTRNIDGIEEVIYKKGTVYPFLLRDYLRQNPPSSDSHSPIYESFSISPRISGIILDHLLKDGEEHNDTNFNITLPSGSYGLLQLIQGRRNLYVDVRKRLFDQFPDSPVRLGKHGKAAMPIDIAAGWFMLKTLGAEITDANRKKLDELPLGSFDANGRWTDECQLSIVAALTPELHEQEMKKIDAAFVEIEQLLKPKRSPRESRAVFPNMD